MRKILVILLTSLMMFVSCGKDSVSRVIFNDSVVNESISYVLTIEQGNDMYSCTVVNSSEEVTTKYTYNYDTKKYLALDFANITNELAKLDDTLLGTLLPMFNYEFNFIDNDDNVAVVSRTVKGGVVFVNFVFATKSFSLPYSFIIKANDKLNPQKK